MTEGIKPNQDWLLDHKHSSQHGSQGKIVFQRNGKEVNNFPLIGNEIKLLKRACREADRQEAVLGVPVNVIVNKVGTEIIISMESEIDE